MVFVSANRSFDGSARHKAAAHPNPSERIQQPIFGDICGAIAAGRLRTAQDLLRGAGNPHEPAILWARAALASREGQPRQAEQLLRRAIRDAPGFAEAKGALATVLLHSGRPVDALDIYSQLVAADPGDIEASIWKAWIEARVGNVEDALATTAAALRNASEDGRLWLHLGNWLQALGRSDEGLRAYRRSTALPHVDADAWWAIANSRASSFSARDVTAMRALLERKERPNERIAIHFALARAEEECGRFEAAFAHLSEGSRLYLQNATADPLDQVYRSEEAQGVFTAEFLDSRRGYGLDSTAPIFIVGMPRSGTTLLEQILDSHSEIEGIGELPYLDEIAREIRSRNPDPKSAIASLTKAEIAAYARKYLDLAGIHRKTSKPHFVDKMPSNWLYIGLIHLLFPTARIIHCRREALDCCVGNFRQYFPKGHEFTYSLEALGRTTRSSEQLIDHFNRVLPGRILLSDHDVLKADPEGEVRALVERINIPFEDGCLRFHENNRAVRTPSASQVRQPVNQAGSGRWRDYALWLGELKQALATAPIGEHRDLAGTGCA